MNESWQTDNKKKQSKNTVQKKFQREYYNGWTV